MAISFFNEIKIGKICVTAFFFGHQFFVASNDAVVLQPNFSCYYARLCSNTGERYTTSCSDKLPILQCLWPGHSITEYCYRECDNFHPQEYAYYNSNAAHSISNLLHFIPAILSEAGLFNFQNSIPFAFA